MVMARGVMSTPSRANASRKWRDSRRSSSRPDSAPLERKKPFVVASAAARDTVSTSWSRSSSLSRGSVVSPTPAPAPLGHTSGSTRHGRDLHVAAGAITLSPLAAAAHVFSTLSLAQVVVATFAVFVVVSALRRNMLKPRVTISQSARLAAIIRSCPTLHRNMRPPLLLQTSLTQLIAYLLKRKKQLLPKAERPMWRREVLPTDDGGEIALDWYMGHSRRGDGDGDGDEIRLPEDAPVVAVMHTLTGLAEDFAELARVAAARGFRTAVCLRRGHLGKPLLTPRFNLLGDVGDMDIHVSAIKRSYPEARALFGYGESAGTGLAVRYSGEKQDDCPFAGVVCVCPGYDTTEGGAFSRFEPMLDKYLLDSVKKMFLEANEDVLRGGSSGSVGEEEEERVASSSPPISPGYDEMMAARGMAEFQRRVYSVEGYGSLEEYHERTNPMGVAGDIAVPLLVINSDDDPICTPSNVDDNLWCFEGNVERVLVRTPIGTHCCFYEGRTLWPRTSWATDASLEFFRAILEEVEEEEERVDEASNQTPRADAIGVSAIA